MINHNFHVITLLRYLLVLKHHPLHSVNKNAVMHRKQPEHMI